MTLSTSHAVISSLPACLSRGLSRFSVPCLSLRQLMEFLQWLLVKVAIVYKSCDLLLECYKTIITSAKAFSLMSVRWLVDQQECTETAEQILTKLGWRMGSAQNKLNFCAGSRKRDGSRNFFFSLSFTRRKMFFDIHKEKMQFYRLAASLVSRLYVTLIYSVTTDMRVISRVSVRNGAGPAVLEAFNVPDKWQKLFIKYFLCLLSLITLYGHGCWSAY